uniref:Uncharacterized protein n=1 Tax=Physcomitrium patens TaxID=3218 RepID=A0A2K1IRF9_PHYPA|nr:hypothetical protein PHYPA_025980 [Physcomitrium patens]
MESSWSFKGSPSEASSSMKSPLSSFMRSPISSSMMPSPVSSRLTMEFENAFTLEAEEPIRFSSADILPYLSEKSTRSSSSDFDTQSDSSGSSSFCNLNDSNRITLASLIGLPMDSFRHFGESFHFRPRGNSHYDSGSNSTIEGPGPRRSRTCSLFSELFRCLQRTRTDFVSAPAPMTRNLTNLTSFTITENSEEGEQDVDSNTGPTVFENSVFVERPTLGSRIYEFNPLYISDAISDVDPTESRALSLSRDSSASQDPSAISSSEEILTSPSVESSASCTRLNLQVSTYPSPYPVSQPLSPIRTVLTTICCQLGDDYPSD